MQYEIYLDKLFLMNMFFNCSILFATKKILKLKSKKRFVLLAGIFGSLGMCSVFLLPFTQAASRLIYLLCFIFPVMTYIAFFKISRRKRIQAGIAVFGIALISGKVIESLYPKICAFTINSKYVGICVTGFAGIWLIQCLGKIYTGLCEEDKKYYTVLIKYHEKEVLVNALYDTGNLLRDPVTGKYVHIVDKATIRQLMVEEQGKSASNYGVRLIPYRTIAKSGLIPVLAMTEMCVSNGVDGFVLKAPLVGISNETISSDGRYHMILNSGEL